MATAKIMRYGKAKADAGEGVGSSASGSFGEDVGRLPSLIEPECKSGGGSMKVDVVGATTDSGSRGISSALDAVSMVM